MLNFKLMWQKFVTKLYKKYVPQKSEEIVEDEPVFETIRVRGTSQMSSEEIEDHIEQTRINPRHSKEVRDRQLGVEVTPPEERVAYPDPELMPKLKLAGSRDKEVALKNQKLLFKKLEKPLKQAVLLHTKFREHKEESLDDYEECIFECCQSLLLRYCREGRWDLYRLACERLEEKVINHCNSQHIHPNYITKLEVTCEESDHRKQALTIVAVVTYYRPKFKKQKSNIKKKVTWKKFSL